jgi:hypothetical protein
MRLRVFRAAIATILISATATFAVTVGQTDDFQDGTTMNWREGGSSPNPPVNVADEGPLGAGDNALFDVSSGTQGPGGRAVFFNTDQWTGDYLSAGVTELTGYARATTASSPLSLRIGLQGGATTRFVTDSAITIPNDDQWYPFSFGINAAELTQAEGSDSLATVLSNVDEFRIISSASPAWRGDVAFTEIYVDNLTAVPEPSSMLLLSIAALGLCRRRRR